MKSGDLDEVVTIAGIGFPNHFEGRACFANRLQVYPKGCLVLAADTAGPLLGYLIAYPWLADAAPALNTLIEGIPVGAKVMYLHDLAILPSARGAGHSRTVVESLAADARDAGWSQLALVAVNDSTAFWERHGFQVRDTPELRITLASYGSDARYMVRRL
jgi:GNAT superfamily N-acetyltransferase